MGVENELAFHLRESLPAALSGESLKNQGFLVGAFTSVGQFVSGEPTEGKRIDHLLKAPRSQWYGGNDPLRAQEQVSGVNRHFAFWGAMMTPVSWDMLQLTKNTGITSGDFLNDNFSIARMNETGKYSFYNQIETRYRQAVYGASLDLENSLWGIWQPDDNENRAPESLRDIMSDTKQLHGLGPTGLGTFDSRHVLGRGNTKFPGWKYVHSPRVFHFNHTDGKGGKPAAGTADKQLTRDNVFQAFDEFLRPWDLIVKGQKMMPIDHRVFGLLAENKFILENDKFSMRIHDGMGWAETKNVVRMHNTCIFSEPNAPEDELWGLHTGTPGGMNGTIYPVFWESTSNRKGRAQLDMLYNKSNQMAAPAVSNDIGMRVKPMPFYHDEVFRFTTRADSTGSNIRLLYMWICQERWCQTIGRGYTID